MRRVLIYSILFHKNVNFILINGLILICCYFQGGLLVGREPLEDVLHGGVRSTVSAKDTPQGLIFAVHWRSPWQDPMLSRVQCDGFTITQSQHSSGCRCWRTGSEWWVPWWTVRLRTIRTCYLYQRTSRGIPCLSRTLLWPTLGNSVSNLCAHLLF